MTKTLTDPKKLVKRLLEAKKGYYSGTPIMSDADFDALEDELKKADPDNAYFKKVGIKTGKEKITHEFPMRSAGKAKIVDEVEEWRGKVGAENLVLQPEPKIDGLSATLRYEDGKLVYVATRGDGKVGQNVSHIKDYVNGILPKISAKGVIEVRGELFIPVKSKVPNPENKPLRNMAVGFVNRKDHGLEDLKWVKFVAYQVVGDKKFSFEHEKLNWLKKEGFNVVQPIPLVTTKQEIEQLRESYLKIYRDAWEYETDGLIFVVDDISTHAKIDSTHQVEHHHHYMIALKPPSEGKETTLLDIEWNVSRQGKLIPIAIVKPVVLGGATVKRCTLNNFDNVKALKLHKGDKVIIERANDVIPFFKKNLTRHDEHMDGLVPRVCPSCGTRTKVEGIHVVCNNSDCKEQQVLKIVHWVKNCEMEAFSEASVRALFDAGKIANIRDLYSLKPKDFAGVEGFGVRKSENALKQIHDTKEMTIGEFADRLGIDLVGKKAIAKLGITTAEEFLNHKDQTFVIGQKIVEYVAENKAFLKDLLSCVTIKKPVAAKVGARQVCMTGTGPKSRMELMGDITKKGDLFVDRVTKDTQLLICEDVNGSSTKLEKARKMGVKLISYDEYFK
jgi:DNA ligase (NAD+)